MVDKKDPIIRMLYAQEYYVVSEDNNVINIDHDKGWSWKQWLFLKVFGMCPVVRDFKFWKELKEYTVEHINGK